MRSCVLIAITTLFPPPSQADATLCYKEGVYLCSVFRIISQSGNNGNNNTHRAGVRTLRVIMLPGTLRRGSDEMGSVIPGPGTSHLPNIFLQTRGSWYLHQGLRDARGQSLSRKRISQQRLDLLSAFVCCVRI